jgi:CBS domain-containing protein
LAVRAVVPARPFRDHDRRSNPTGPFPEPRWYHSTASFGADVKGDEMKISDLLERKGSFVATVTSEMVIIEVARELADRGVGALVVSEDGRTISGIVSERDIVRAVSRFGPAILESPVQMIMSREVRTCLPDDLVESLMATMTDNRIRHVPVASGGVLLGIVSIGDLVKTRMDELERDRAALESYITAR